MHYKSLVYEKKSEQVINDCKGVHWESNDEENDAFDPVRNQVWKPKQGVHQHFVCQETLDSGYVITSEGQIHCQSHEIAGKHCCVKTALWHEVKVARIDFLVSICLDGHFNVPYEESGPS